MVEDDDGRFRGLVELEAIRAGAGPVTTPPAPGPCGAVVLVVFAAWAVHRVQGLSVATQATNPIIRWEWLFLRPADPHELWAATLQHLQLTLMAVGIGLVLSCGLAAIALRFRWTFAPITAFTGFLYTIPSVALFGVLNTSFSNTASAEIALVSYTLLVLVRNIVAGDRRRPRVRHRRGRRARHVARAGGSCQRGAAARPAGDRGRASGWPR